MTATTVNHLDVPTSCDPVSRVTRSLLGYGVVAGVLYLTVGVIEGASRDGFDVHRHALSLLSNGPWGWVHRLDLAVAGSMVIAAAMGIRRAVRGGIGHHWLWRLVAGYGIGMIIAAAFNADPMDGFLGTPDGPPAEPTFAGTMHMIASSLAFVSLAAAAAVLARRLHHSGCRRAAAASALAALIAVAGFATTTTLGVWISVVTMWLWLATASIHYYRGTARNEPA